MSAAVEAHPHPLTTAHMATTNNSSLGMGGTVVAMHLDPTLQSSGNTASPLAPPITERRKSNNDSAAVVASSSSSSASPFAPSHTPSTAVIPSSSPSSMPTLVPVISTGSDEDPNGGNARLVAELKSSTMAAAVFPTPAPSASPIHGTVDYAGYATHKGTASGTASSSRRAAAAGAGGSGGTSGGSGGTIPLTNSLSPHLSGAISAAIPSPQSPARDACVVACELLSRLLELYEACVKPNISQVTEKEVKILKGHPKYHLFLEALQELYEVDIEVLDHKQRLCFYINLFNILVLHANIVLGPPATIMQRAKFLAKFTYTVGQLGVVSPGVIEHALLRGAMSRPNAFASRFLPLPKFTPSSPQHAYVLKRNEPLITFALCHGALSSPGVVVYYPESVQQQLQAAAAHYIQHHVRIDLIRRQVVLPKLLEWYRADFASTNEQLLDWVCSFLSESAVASVQQMYLSEEGACPRIKFANFRWDVFFWRPIQALAQVGHTHPLVHGVSYAEDSESPNTAPRSLWGSEHAREEDHRVRSNGSAALQPPNRRGSSSVSSKRPVFIEHSEDSEHDREEHCEFCGAAPGALPQATEGDAINKDSMFAVYLGRVLRRMKSGDGVEAKDRTWLFKKYRSCFVGQQAVRWLMAYPFPDVDAAVLAQRSLNNTGSPSVTAAPARVNLTRVLSAQTAQQIGQPTGATVVLSPRPGRSPLPMESKETSNTPPSQASSQHESGTSPEHPSSHSSGETKTQDPPLTFASLQLNEPSQTVPVSSPSNSLQDQTSQLPEMLSSPLHASSSPPASSPVQTPSPAPAPASTPSAAYSFGPLSGLANFGTVWMKRDSAAAPAIRQTFTEPEAIAILQLLLDIGAVSGTDTSRVFRPGPMDYYRFETSPREWQLLNQLCAEMQAPHSGLEVRDRKLHGYKIKNCFVAAEAVDYLMARSSALTRQKALGAGDTSRPSSPRGPYTREQQLSLALLLCPMSPVSSPTGPPVPQSLSRADCVTLCRRLVDNGLVSCAATRKHSFKDDTSLFKFNKVYSDPAAAAAAAADSVARITQLERKRTEFSCLCRGRPPAPGDFLGDFMRADGPSAPRAHVEDTLEVPAGGWKSRREREWDRGRGYSERRPARGQRWAVRDYVNTRGSDFSEPSVGHDEDVEEEPAEAEEAEDYDQEAEAEQADHADDQDYAEAEAEAEVATAPEPRKKWTDFRGPRDWLRDRRQQATKGKQDASAEGSTSLATRLSTRFRVLSGWRKEPTESKSSSAEKKPKKKGDPITAWISYLSGTSQPANTAESDETATLPASGAAPASDSGVAPSLAAARGPQDQVSQDFMAAVAASSTIAASVNSSATDGASLLATSLDSTTASSTVSGNVARTAPVLASMPVVSGLRRRKASTRPDADIPKGSPKALLSPKPSEPVTSASPITVPSPLPRASPRPADALVAVSRSSNHSPRRAPDSKPSSSRTRSQREAEKPLTRSPRPPAITSRSSPSSVQSTAREQLVANEFTLPFPLSGFLAFGISSGTLMAILALFLLAYAPAERYELTSRVDPLEALVDGTWGYAFPVPSTASARFLSIVCCAFIASWMFMASFLLAWRSSRRSPVDRRMGPAAATPPPLRSTSAERRRGRPESARLESEARRGSHRNSSVRSSTASGRPVDAREVYEVYDLVPRYGEEYRGALGYDEKDYVSDSGSEQTQPNTVSRFVHRPSSASLERASLERRRSGHVRTPTSSRGSRRADELTPSEDTSDALPSEYEVGGRRITGPPSASRDTRRPRPYGYEEEPRPPLAARAPESEEEDEDSEGEEEEEASVPTVVDAAQLGGLPTASVTEDDEDEKFQAGLIPTIPLEEAARLPTLIYPLRVTNQANTVGPTLVIPNAREPLEFENQFFKGKVLFKVRSTPRDPYYAPYFETYKNHVWELMIEGNFKQHTKGVVFLGLEVPNANNMGMLKRAIAKVLLKVVSAFNPNMHYDFGDDPKFREADGTSWGHLVFPLAQAADRLIITAPGQTPPPIGVDMLPEKLSLDKRKNNVQMIFDPESTHSISFHSRNLDICQWKVVNVRGSKDVDMSLFWDYSPIRLVAYQVEGATSKDPHKVPHTPANRQYFFCFEVRHDGTLTRWAD